MSELIIIKKIDISSQLDWNNLVSLAKQLLEGDFDVRVFYEAQMIEHGLMTADFEYLKTACVSFIEATNFIHGLPENLING